MKNDKNTGVYLLLILTTVIWGGTFVAAKVIVAGMHPLIAASTRFILAFLVLLPLMLFYEGANAKIRLRDIPILSALGATGIFLYNIFFFYGLQRTTAMNGSLLVAAGPAITAVFSALFLKEKLSLKQVLGFIISLVGVLVIVTKGSPGVLMKLQVNSGDLMLAVSTTSWSVYSILGKVAVGRFNPLISTTYAFGFGAVFLTLFAAPLWSKETFVQFTPVVIYCLLFLAVIASALCFVIWFRGIERIGASKAAIFQNIVPLSASTLAIILLGEELRAFHLIGAVFILGGVSLVTGMFAGIHVEKNGVVGRKNL